MTDTILAAVPDAETALRIARHAQSEKIKEELVLYAQLLDRKGLVNSVEGNLSIYDRETKRLYITPSGTRKAFVTQENVAVMEGNSQVEGSLPRSSEYRLHMAALAARPDCNAVAHIHAPYLTAYAYCGMDIEIKCSTSFSLLFEKIPCLPYGEPGTAHIADGIEDALREYDLLLLANHGAVAVGKRLEDAVKLVEAAEEVLKIYHLAQSIGKVSNLNDTQLESLYANHPASKRNRRGK